MGDNVNHPNHYQNIAGVEAIDILNDVVNDLPGKQAAMLWNTLKYLLRFQKKNGVEDLKKAQNYLDYLINDIEAVNEDKSMSAWAKREVEIACKKENTNRKDVEYDYGCACYESALKAFESLCRDGHSGYSVKMTQAILNRLIDGKPLTPIEDTDDVWNLFDNHEDGYISYHCKRMSSLFKDVYADGTVKYDDVNRSYCIDIHNSNNEYSLGLVRRIINAMFPITMPYMPGKPIKVYCEEFLTDIKNGDFDTVGVFYALKTENGQQEKIEINRFFREPKDNEKLIRGWVEISKEEYMQRKDKRLNAFSNKEDK